MQSNQTQVLNTLSSSKKLALEERLISKGMPVCQTPPFSPRGNVSLVNELISRPRKVLQSKTELIAPKQNVDKLVLSPLNLGASQVQENGPTCRDSSKQLVTPLSQSVISSTSMDAISLDILRASSELDRLLQAKEISKQKSSGVLDLQEQERREVLGNPLLAPTGNKIVRGGVGTILRPTPVSSSMNIDAILANSLSSSNCSTDIRYVCKVREATATLELARYLFPLPNLLNKPGRQEQMKMYNSFFEELNTLLNSILLVSGSITKETPQHFTPAVLATKVVDQLNQLISFNPKRKRCKRRKVSLPVSPVLSLKKPDLIVDPQEPIVLLSTQEKEVPKVVIENLADYKPSRQASVHPKDLKWYEDPQFPVEDLEPLPELKTDISSDSGDSTNSKSFLFYDKKRKKYSPTQEYLLCDECGGKYTFDSKYPCACFDDYKDCWLSSSESESEQSDSDHF